MRELKLKSLECMECVPGEVPDGEGLGADQPVHLLTHQLVEDIEEPGHVTLELLLAVISGGGE
jgi:hypothetical protein